MKGDAPYTGLLQPVAGPQNTTLTAFCSCHLFDHFSAQPTCTTPKYVIDNVLYASTNG